MLNSITTSTPNGLHRLVSDENGEYDVYVSATEYSTEKAALFERLTSASFASKNIDELSYKRLMAAVEIKTDIDVAVEHFADLFDQLKQVIRDDIETRIIKGADFIETHGEVPTAVKRYEKLCDDLAKLDGRYLDADNDQTN